MTSCHSVAGARCEGSPWFTGSEDISWVLGSDDIQ